MELAAIIIPSVLGLFGSVFGAWITYKIAALGKVADATHILVNSNMGTQLKLTAVALRRIANQSKYKEDEDAAALAEKAYAEHQMKQSIVDGVGK